MPRGPAPPLILLCAFAVSSCATFGHRAPDEPLPVKTVEEPIVVAAWSEPKHRQLMDGLRGLLSHYLETGEMLHP